MKTILFIIVLSFVQAGSVQVPQMVDREWIWVKTVMNDDNTITPVQSDAFQIKFKENGKFTGKTDCNSYFGEYEVEGNKITVDITGSTRMFCEDSQEDDFLDQLRNVDNYFINGEGNLILLLKFDSGSMIFSSNRSNITIRQYSSHVLSSIRS
jgi:heat shock protein HslJ